MDSQVKTLIKEKKEKDNVLTNLESTNLKNAFLLNFEKFRRKTTKAKKKSWWRKKGVSKEFAIVASIIGDGIGAKEESRTS